MINNVLTCMSSIPAAGLMRILLPDILLDINGNYHYDAIPSRLADNAESTYSGIHTWDWITSHHIFE